MIECCPMHMQALQTVLGNDSGSLFSEQMLSNGVDAIGSAFRLVPYPGDSFYDQVEDFTELPKEADRKVPLGVSVGVAVVGAAILAASAMLTIFILRHRRQHKQQKVSTRLVSVMSVCLSAALTVIIWLCADCDTSIDADIKSDKPCIAVIRMHIP